MYHQGRTTNQQKQTGLARVRARATGFGVRLPQGMLVLVSFSNSLPLFSFVFRVRAPPVCSLVWCLVSGVALCPSLPSLFPPFLSPAALSQHVRLRFCFECRQ